MAPKKKGSFLTRGRERVQQTRQLKSAAAARQLPSKGGTGANRPKATAQRTATAVRQRVTQDVATLKALGDNMRRNQARADRQIPADKSPSVRRVGPGGANPKPQGQLPPGQRGGAIQRKGGAITRPSGTAATTARPSRPSPRPGGRVVVDESPRLPPGQRGGALTTKSGSRPALPPAGGSSSPPYAPRGWATLDPNATYGGRTRPTGGSSERNTANNSSRPSGRPAQSPGTASTRAGGGSRPALPPGRQGGPMVSGGARPSSTPKPSGGAARPPIKLGGVRAGLIGLVGGIAADALGRRAGEAIGTSMRNSYNTPKEDKRPNLPGGRSKPNSRPASQYEKLYDTGGGRGNYGLDRAPKPERAPSGGSPRPSSAQSRPAAPSSSSSSSRSSSSRPSPAASSAPAKPGQQWKDFNPGRGTSKTNNPLLKNNEYLMSKIRQREQREQTNAIGPVKDGNTYAGSIQKPTGRGPVANAEEYGNMLKIDKKKKEKA